MLSHQAYAAHSVYVAILVGPYILTIAAQHLGPVSTTGEDPSRESGRDFNLD
jgi:hypothetical protein